MFVVLKDKTNKFELIIYILYNLNLNHYNIDYNDVSFT